MTAAAIAAPVGDWLVFSGFTEAVPSPVALLPDRPDGPADVLAKVTADFESLSARGLPVAWEEWVLDRYGLDVRTEYGGIPIRNPWGKASGQLSMNAAQVADDVAAGLGFVVLKTVIAQDSDGGQTMQAWAVRESRMDVEPIRGRSGEAGWTVTWKGRGWWQPFGDYLRLVQAAGRIAAQAAGHRQATLIVPSVKYHLPQFGETAWRTDEYNFTTRAIQLAWIDGHGVVPARLPMPLEKDFSPTLAGSDRASVRETVIEWLQRVPDLIRESVRPGSVRVGLKLFNAMFDDAFQVEMLRSIHGPGQGRPDFFVYGNRLFDPQRMFDGHRGAAYGGPDLSDRNLRVMSDFQNLDVPRRLPWSATGNITSGRMAVAYALRGASSFQLHTFFQVPLDQYRLKTGTRTQRALFELLLHPQQGFVVWMHHLGRRLDLPLSPLRLQDLVHWSG